MVQGHLEVAHGTVVVLTVDGVDRLAAMDSDSVDAAIAYLCEEASRLRADIIVGVTGDSSPVAARTPEDVVFRPDGTFGAAYQPQFVGGSLTHDHHEAIPEGLDLFSTPPPAAAPVFEDAPAPAPQAEEGETVDIEALFNPAPTADTYPEHTQHLGELETAHQEPGSEPVDYEAIFLPAPPEPGGSFFDDLFVDDQPSDVSEVSTPVTEAAEAVATPTEGIDPNALSRSELESWVSDTVLNPDLATVGEGTIRTRAESSARKPVVVTAALAVAVICLIGLVVTVATGDDPAPQATPDTPQVGPYALTTVDLTIGEDADRWVVPGFEKTWNTDAPEGASVAALSHAVVIATSEGLSFRRPDDGAVLGASPVHGRIDEVLTATVEDVKGNLVNVVSWQQGKSLALYLFDQKRQPLRMLQLPKGASVSSRGGGIVVITNTRAGRVMLGKGRQPVVKWFPSPDDANDTDGTTVSTSTSGETVVTAAHRGNDEDKGSASEEGMWAYAATPQGDVWWLGDDGTVKLPDGPGETRNIEMVRPRSGVRFSGWIGASIRPDEGTTGTLVAVWYDPATKRYHLVTHNSTTGEPVNAVEAELRDVQVGASGVRSSHLAVGPFLIDATSGKIVVNGGEDFRFVAVAGDVASVRTPDGSVGLVNLTWIRAGRDLRVQVTSAKLLGADADGNVVVQTPGSQVVGYRAVADE